jgi:signal transduction histidine kinase
MLRTRFTFAVAAAVAAVTLAVTAVAFLVVRADLHNQLKLQLRQQAAVVHREARHYHGHIPTGWVPPHSDRFGAASPYTQLVTASGTVWAAAGHRGLLAGVRAMVFTTPLAPRLAVQLAALAGWAVARAGPAPVSRLAAVAEQVTVTGDPAGRVEVGRADELGRLATSFNTMLRALQRSQAAQRRLVSDASHELRTPLTSLRINVELLADDPGLSAAERQQVLDRVVAQVAELSQLVGSVTELARGESGPSAHGQVSLHEVAAAAALESARRDWPRTAFAADLEPCGVFGSAPRLQVAIRNLLDNAAKFGPPDTPVEVRLRAGELTVRDHGPGIAAADRLHVFGRFYRAPSARGVPGSGLGLAIVRQVAESHGGTVQAEAPAGGGTLLRLRLPPGPAWPPRTPESALTGSVR